MDHVVEILEERVAAAADLIVNLRARVMMLECELAAPRPPAAPPPACCAAPLPDSELREELERLRAERVVIRENIRGLLREIDRVSW